MILVQHAAAVVEESKLKVNLLQFTELGPLLDKVFTVIGAIVGVILLFFLIYGGFLYMTAGGNAEQTKKGGQAIVNAVIGLVILLAAYAITVYLVKTLGTQAVTPTP